MKENCVERVVVEGERPCVSDTGIYLDAEPLGPFLGSSNHRRCAINCGYIHARWKVLEVASGSTSENQDWVPRFNAESIDG